MSSQIIELTTFELDPLGRLIVSDEMLESLDKTFDITTSGANGFCSGSGNTSCSNGTCGGSTNSLSCTNSGFCVNSSNSISCR